MNIRRRDEYVWEIPVGTIPGMHVPGRVYVDERMMASLRSDGSLRQVANAATLPGATMASLAMPDIHFGYGLPIGGVLASRTRDGVVSPGGVGFDINCGVRLVSTPLMEKDVSHRMEKIVDKLFANIPAGVGSSGKIHLTKKNLQGVLQDGARWAVRTGYGFERDTVFCESSGAMIGAAPDCISERAYERGADQLGTLGSGNHFIEVQKIVQVEAPDAADVLGLQTGQIVVMIHSGSRGLGHQVCTDSLKTMNRALSRYGLSVPDRQLACAPVSSPEGRDYLGSMKAAANFAWANRQCMTHWVREVFHAMFSDAVPMESMRLIYDVAHNIVKVENHVVDGHPLELAVHRKGATRAFGPGHRELPSAYQTIGQPVIIPGDMGTESYILLGTDTAMKTTFGSACHGAGRRLSRKAAVREARNRSVVKELRTRGIIVRAAGRRTIAEEMPDAYKNISDVVRVVVGSGIAKCVARMQPLGVIKG